MEEDKVKKDESEERLLRSGTWKVRGVALAATVGVGSTRIFVRGLPPKFTDADFKSHFAAKGTITDSRLIPNRRIGYVGYKTTEEAEAAVKYFNKTFIRMSRIGVELARPVADEGLPRAWSARTPGSSAYMKKHEKKPDSDPKESASEKSLKRKRGDAELPTTAVENDPKLKEYLEVMQPRSKTKTWANEDLSLLGRGPADAEAPVATVEAGESDDEYENIPTKQKKQKPSHPVASTINTSSADADVEMRENDDQTAQPNAEETNLESSEQQPVPVSDSDWLRSKTSRLLDITDDIDAHLAKMTTNDASHAPEKIPPPPEKEDGEKEWNGIDDANEDGSAEEEQSAEKSEADEAIETVSESGRLFLRNLSYTSTEDDLRNHFLNFGELQEVHLPIDNKTQSSKGFAYVLFKNPAEAVEAFKALDKKIFQGRLLHILAAAPKRENKLDEFAMSKLPLKKQRELKRKAGAASNQFSWNSMYMNADAVMSSIADRLGVSKSELLDPTSSDAAVRQAHAETHVIQETKAYFKMNGMDLAAFEQRERDDKVILLKNFPYGTKLDELKKMLSEFGQLGRVLMPPAGTIAVAEFTSAPAARAAFAGLAYRRFKESILFLEKAPKGLFTEDYDPVKALATNINIPEPAKSKVSAQDLLEAAPGSAETLDTSTLFVRNLNFSTTSAGLTEVFKPIDGFLSARVKTKPDPKKAGSTLSMGFGFVEFRSKAQALAALAAMDGFALDGHKLAVKASHKGLDAAAERKKEDTKRKEAGKRTKIIIKNLPFEATKKDVRALFGQYGTLRTVRVPKKFGGVARGFAFAEFVTAREAENAMDSLRDTHLLGRRLVLDFAAQEAENAEEEIERMSKKVAKQTDLVNFAKLKANSKRKIDLDETGNVVGEDED
ncbi:Multiple RNA-binding domain-containing protein 1 [Rhizina undulata]